MSGLDSILESFRLRPDGDDRYRADNADTGHAVVFGGQLLGQSLVAALADQDDKTVTTLHTVFARAGSPEVGVEIAVDRMHSGRSAASSTVTITQGDRLCTRSQVLLSAPADDFIHHHEPAPDVFGPDHHSAVGHLDGWEIRMVDDVDISDPSLVGPPTLDVWTRFPGAPTDAGIPEALLAFASDGFLIATAMRPHEGVGQSLAHQTLSTAVLSHTLTFHEPFDAGDWLLISHRSPHSGHGRSYGQASVFDTDGRLVASFVQDAMIRPMARPGAAL